VAAGRDRKSTLQQSFQAPLAGIVHPQAHALDVAAVLPFHQHPVDHPLAEFWRGQAGQHLQVGELLQDLGIRGQIAHPQAGRQHLGIAAHQDHPLQAVQRGQLHGAAWMQFAVGVVLDHQEIVAFGDAQDVVGGAGRQRVAGGVVHRTVDDEELGLVLGRQLFEQRGRPGRAARRSGARRRRPAGRR